MIISRFSDSMIERRAETCFSMEQSDLILNRHRRRHTMKTYLIAALLIAATVTPVVAAETFVAPATPKQAAPTRRPRRFQRETWMA